MRLATRHASTIKAGLPEPVPQARCVLRDSQSRMFLMFASDLSVWARVVSCDVRSMGRTDREKLRNTYKEEDAQEIAALRSKKTARSTNMR